MILKDAAHVPQAEQYRNYNAEVLEFLTRHCNAGSESVISSIIHSSLVVAFYSTLVSFNCFGTSSALQGVSVTLLYDRLLSYSALVKFEETNLK